MTQHILDRPNLPELAFAMDPATGSVIAIGRGQTEPLPVDTDEEPDRLNQINGVTAAQASAMLAGLKYGWDCPAADPDRYDLFGRASGLH